MASGLLMLEGGISISNRIVNSKNSSFIIPTRTMTANAQGAGRQCIVEHSLREYSKTVPVQILRLLLIGSDRVRCREER